MLIIKQKLKSKLKRIIEDLSKKDNVLVQKNLVQNFAVLFKDNLKKNFDGFFKILIEMSKKSQILIQKKVL